MASYSVFQNIIQIIQEQRTGNHNDAVVFQDHIVAVGDDGFFAADNSSDQQAFFSRRSFSAVFKKRVAWVAVNSTASICPSSNYKAAPQRALPSELEKERT